MSPKILFVWDFDRTIILDDTDQAVITTLAPNLLPILNDRNHIRTHGWLSTVNAVLARLAHQSIPPHAIIDAAANTNLPIPTASALRRIAETPFAQSAIVSDSNSHYISACLTRHNLQNFFSAGIHTNVAHVQNDRLQLIAYSIANSLPHNCQTCDPRLCKGDVVRRLILNCPTDAFVVYVGDGSNDFCPATILSKRDVVLYRKGFSLERKLSAGIAARTFGWKTPNDLALLVDAMLTEGASNTTPSTTTQVNSP